MCAGDEGEVWFSYNRIEDVVADLLRDKRLDGHIDWDYTPLYGLDCEGIKSRLHGPFSASTYFEEACRLCDLDSGVFSGFYDLHSEAKMRLCPDRRFRSTRLFLAFWAADLLEHWNLRCMIQGNCISCKCPKDRLRLGEIIPVDGDGQWRYPRYDSKEEKRRFQVAGDSAANMNI